MVVGNVKTQAALVGGFLRQGATVDLLHSGWKRVVRHQLRLHSAEHHLVVGHGTRSLFSPLPMAQKHWRKQIIVRENRITEA